MKNNKSINDITLFRYLFNLDNRDLPQSILNWYSKVGSVVDSDRENAIRELSKIKGNCRNLVIFSKTFIDTMDKSYMKFTQFHMDILNELDNENGIVRSPYFLEGCYVVYSIKNGCLTLWIFQDRIDKYLSIPTYYICVSPKDKIKGEGHQLDCMVLPLLDNCMEANLRDYIDMVLDYLCLRQWAEVQLAKVLSTVKKEIKKNKKTQIIISNLEECIKYLEEIKIPYKIISDKVVEIYEKFNISELVTALSKRKCIVNAFKEQEETLESYYLNLIGGAENV